MFACLILLVPTASATSAANAPYDESMMVSAILTNISTGEVVSAITEEVEMADAENGIALFSSPASFETEITYGVSFAGAVPEVMRAPNSKSATSWDGSISVSSTVSMSYDQFDYITTTGTHAMTRLDYVSASWNKADHSVVCSDRSITFGQQGRTLSNGGFFQEHTFPTSAMSCAYNTNYGEHISLTAMGAQIYAYSYCTITRGGSVWGLQVSVSESL